ncbi:hypothetical protein [Methanolobus psychrotolerans]|uniref:hypothetical protein n=1 Tax=Methanolobus psychrotolerans TaxID=1874706 RepID=UPI00101AE1F1|nr:hypothetical protein [Methanolobus psychrotolerans]
MRRNISILFTLFMILFSTAIPGVYALENDTGMEMPQMGAEQMKEMNLEMIENNIDTLTSLQSELDDEDVVESVKSLLEQMEALKTELEATDDEKTIMEIMDELRSSMGEAPEVVREALMKNNPMGQEGQEGHMEGAGHMGGNESMQLPESNFPGNGTMNGEGQMGKPDNGDATKDETTDDDTSEESTGLLTGLINMIKGLF